MADFQVLFPFLNQQFGQLLHFEFPECQGLVLDSFFGCLLCFGNFSSSSVLNVKCVLRIGNTNYVINEMMA